VLNPVAGTLKRLTRILVADPFSIVARAGFAITVDFQPGITVIVIDVFVEACCSTKINIEKVVTILID